MNTYSKYCPNVFLAKCEESYQKGDIIEVTTKYGQSHECEVHNLIFERDGFFFYSVIRADGFNAQERAKRKVERLNGYAANAEARSDRYRQASNEGAEFLRLAEPIKIGHHSEKKHRALIERNWNRFGKAVAESDKAREYEARASYWEGKANDINLSMPESIEYYEFKLEKAKQLHQGMKDGSIPRSHSFSLSYAKKDVNEAEKNLELAKKLWG